jgi:hypothetical protein
LPGYCKLAARPDEIGFPRIPLGLFDKNGPTTAHVRLVHESVAVVVHSVASFGTSRMDVIAGIVTIITTTAFIPMSVSVHIYARNLAIYTIFLLRCIGCSINVSVPTRK